ncbi:MAG: hypothetical protein ACRDRK_18835 [Pseudonocardia sp.]
MTARTSRTTQQPTTQPAAQARMIPAGSVVMNVVVRVAGTVPTRLDLTHVGTPEQRLGMSLGTVLVYLRSGITARAVAEAWGRASGLGRSLPPALAGRRPLVVGPSTIGALVQLAGIPQTTAVLVPAHDGPGAPQMLRIGVGPMTWEVCDANAYTSLLRAWRQAARLIEDNPGEDDDHG